MKQNIYRAFDEIKTLSNSIENIKEDSIHAPIDINLHKIKTGALEKAGIQKPKKHRKKKVLISLIAAAMILAAVSSTAIAENSSLIFGTFFGGDTYAATVSNAEDVQVNVKDSNLNVSVTGLTGDERSVWIELALTKKDGGAFVDSEYTLAQRGTMGYELLNSCDNDNKNGDIKIILDYNDYPSNSGFSWGIGNDVQYSFENNNKTLKMCIFIDDISEYTDENVFEESTWNNRTLKIQSIRFIAGKIDTVIETFDNMDTNAMIKMSELVQRNSSLIPYNLLTNTFTNTGIYYNRKTFDFYKGTFKSINIPFDISLKLNYTVDSQKISINDETALKIFDTPHTNCQMFMSAARLSIYARNDGSHEGEAVPLDRETSMVIMENGTKYYLSSQNACNSNGLTTMRLRYTLFPNEGSDQYGNVLNYNNYYVNDQMIDYSKVSKIIINGITVYTK